MSSADLPDVSVVIAHYNRQDSIVALLTALGEQTFAKSRFEVVVVDDGSREDPTARLTALALPYTLQVTRQKNGGAAAARDNGIKLARGRVLIIIDDDMKLPLDFIERHFGYHEGGAKVVVLGRMRPDAALATMPIFERFHALMLDKMAESFGRGETPRGNDLFTGNVSLRREDYLAVGGFDRALGHSEDAELGVRLEKLGVRFLFSETAYSIHASDHVVLEKWMKRAVLYGMYDRRIARKHPDYPRADPWRFFGLVNPISRPFLAFAVVAPKASEPLARVFIRLAMVIDGAGLSRPGVAATTLVFGMEYFRGLRNECGSLGAAFADYRAYREKLRHHSP